VLRIYSSDPAGNQLSQAVQAQKTKPESSRGVVSNKYKYQATIIYRPRLQFSCMLVVFAASAAAISSAI